MNDRVTVSIQDGVADVRLNRPDKMNALDQAMFDALIETGVSLKTRHGVRAVVLSGEGRAFCAGLDMGRFQQMATPGAESAHELRLGPRTHGDCNVPQYAAMVWRDLPMPVIAALQGVAFGGGLQIALGADIRLASGDCKLSLMEIRWGIVPDMGGTVLLRELMPADRIRELAYTGKIVSGQEAAELGLVTRVSEQPLDNAMALAREIARQSPDAVRAAKRLIRQAGEGPAAEQLLRESREQIALLGGANQAEAVRARLEKREPRFIDP